jgi:hypothetical protein
MSFKAALRAVGQAAYVRSIDRYPNVSGIRASESCCARHEHSSCVRDWRRHEGAARAAKIGLDCEDPAVVVGGLVEPELEQDLADLCLDGLGTRYQQFRDRAV